jgi:creatinine amidohydrolase
MINMKRLLCGRLLLVCCVAASTVFAASDPADNGGYSIFRETLVDMTWPQVKAQAEADALVILPIAVIEEHGPHLSLGTDTYLTYFYSKRLKEELESRQIKAVVAPPIYWGIMQLNETGAYPGSFTIEPSTMKALIHDILADLKRWGFHRVYPMSLHGDRVHRRTVAEAMAEASQTLGLEIFGDENRDRKNRPAVAQYKVANPYSPDYHGGAAETGHMMAHFPNEVNVETVKTLKPEGTFHPLGYVGDPANYQNANVAATEAYVRAEANDIARWLKKP